MSQLIQQYDFTLEEVQKLFQMQDTLNSYIHPEWKTQDFNWGLAIVDECMEIHGHLGWKWWKKGYQVGLTEENRGQIQLEVIDILHFAISYAIQDEYSIDFAAKNLNKVAYHYPDFTFALKAILESAAHYNIALSLWVELATFCDLTKQQILETYTQKYVLNKFRQDHGYKDGTYQKEWGFQAAVGLDNYTAEDNFWLEQIVTRLRQGNHSTTDENLLYSELKALYNSRLNQ